MHQEGSPRGPVDSAPKVSVVVTAYNSRAFILDALWSVARQTFRDFELIVVDDGSTQPGLEDLCEAFARESGTPVLYAYKTNGGPSSARNRGMRMAKGRYLAFLDADDRFQPTKLARQVALLDRLDEGYACVIGSSLWFRDTARRGKRLVRQAPVDGRLDIDRLLTGELALEGTPASYLLRSAAVIEVGGFDEALRHNEDFDLLVRLSREFGIKTHDDLVCDHRLRADSLSQSADPAQVLTHITLFAEKLWRDFPEVSRDSIRRMLQRAYFWSGIRFLNQGRVRNYIWAINEGVGLLGEVRSMRGRLVYISAVFLAALGRRPSGLGFCPRG